MALQNSCPHCHQPDRTNADDGHRRSEFRIQLLHALKSSTHHIRHHDRLFQSHPFRYQCQIHLRISDIIFLHKRTASVRKVHTAVHVVLMLLGSAILSFHTAPYGHDRTYDNSVAHLKIMDV